jgi:hypothetical protein
MEKLSWEETLKRNYEHRQAVEAARPKVACAYCGKSVYTQDYGEWVEFGPIVNVHLEDGRHFHTDCYQVHLIEKASK